MILKLFRLGILLGLLGLAAEAVELSQSLNDFALTALGDWAQRLER